MYRPKHFLDADPQIAHPDHHPLSQHRLSAPLQSHPEDRLLLLQPSHLPPPILPPSAESHIYHSRPFPSLGPSPLSHHPPLTAYLHASSYPRPQSSAQYDNSHYAYRPFPSTSYSPHCSTSQRCLHTHETATYTYMPPPTRQLHSVYRRPEQLDYYNYPPITTNLYSPSIAVQPLQRPTCPISLASHSLSPPLLSLPAVTTTYHSQQQPYYQRNAHSIYKAEQPSSTQQPISCSNVETQYRSLPSFSTSPTLPQLYTTTTTTTASSLLTTKDSSIPMILPSNSTHVEIHTTDQIHQSSARRDWSHSVSERQLSMTESPLFAPTIRSACSETTDFEYKLHPLQNIPMLDLINQFTQVQSKRALQLYPDELMAASTHSAMSSTSRMSTPSLQSATYLSISKEGNTTSMDMLSIDTGQVSDTNTYPGTQNKRKKKKKKRPNLPQNAINIMKDWLLNNTLNPYPSDTQKATLMIQTNLTVNQINNWFINARRRILPLVLQQSPGYQKPRRRQILLHQQSSTSLDTASLQDQSTDVSIDSVLSSTPITLTSDHCQPCSQSETIRHNSIQTLDNFRCSTKPVDPIGVIITVPANTIHSQQDLYTHIRRQLRKLHSKPHRTHIHPYRSTSVSSLETISSQHESHSHSHSLVSSPQLPQSSSNGDPTSQ